MPGKVHCSVKDGLEKRVQPGLVPPVRCFEIDHEDGKGLLV